MKQISIFSWLMMGFAAILFLIAVFGSVIVFKLGDLQQITHSAAYDDANIRQSVLHLLEIVHSQSAFERKFFVSGDKDFLQQFESLVTEVDLEFARLMPLVQKRSLREPLTRAEELYRQYQEVVDDQLASGTSSDNGLRRPFRQIKDSILQEVVDQLTVVQREVQNDRDEKMQVSNDLSLFLYRLTAFSIPILMLVGGIISVFTTRSIHKPLTLLRNRLRLFGSNQFQTVTAMRSPAEIVELTEDFNKMSRKLSELDRMKADFFSHVSHELRTPLTSIGESAALLQEGLYRDRPDKEAELFDIIEKESRRLIDNVNGLLDLSRLEAGMMEFQFREGDVGKVVEHVVSVLAPIADRKNITLSLLNGESLPSVRMDPEQIGHVVRNLIGNALKFTPENGHIAVTFEIVENGSRSVCVKVSDTGCGIPTEQLLRIFDKYSVAHGIRKSGSGTGLGLAIAKRIVEAHKGKIWAENHPDIGCILSFTLPVALR